MVKIVILIPNMAYIFFFKKGRKKIIPYMKNHIETKGAYWREINNEETPKSSSPYALVSIKTEYFLSLKISIGSTYVGSLVP